MKKIIMKTARKNETKRNAEKSSKNNSNKYLVCVGKNF